MDDSSFLENTAWSAVEGLVQTMLQESTFNEKNPN